MKNVHVNASGSYDITIGSGLLPQLGALLKPVKSDCRVAVITDDTVNGFYGLSLIHISRRPINIPELWNLWRSFPRPSAARSGGWS